MLRLISTLIFMASALCWVLLYSINTHASPPVTTSFYPTWKLLNAQEKRQFISGYRHGWYDASNIIDIAIHYVKENPHNAVAGLESLRTLYDLSTIKPDSLVREIDLFYADVDNREAGLAKAITTAKSKLQ